MFKFFGQNNKEQLPSLPRQPDALNESATQIAIELIEGKGGEVYLSGMKRIFRNVPAMMNDVAPEYRESLKKVLEREDFCS